MRAPYYPRVTMQLRQLGARTRVYDAEGDDLGVATLPRPVEPGDLFSLEHGQPLRVTAVLLLEAGDVVECVIEAELAHMPIIG